MRAQGAAHGEVRGVADVDALDLADGGGADAPGQAARLISSTSASRWRSGQRLGVAHAGDLAGVGPDQHGGRDDRRAERARADLVDAHDEAPALAPEGMLGTQVGLGAAVMLAPGARGRGAATAAEAPRPG